MKYPELCKALERKLGVATVYFDRFPYLGSRGSGLLHG